LGPRGAVEEVPGPELALLAFDEQQAPAHEDEKALLAVLPMVEAHRLPGLKDVEVDAEVRKAALALEVAEGAHRLGVAPADLARVDDEPARFVWAEPELRALEWRFRNHHP